MKVFTALAIAVVSALVVRSCWRSSPEKIIEKRLTELALLTSFEGEIHPFEALAKGNEVSKFFSEPFKAELQFEDETRSEKVDRKEIAQHFVALRRHLAQLAVGVSQVKISVSGDRATVTATVRAMGRTPGRDDYFLEEHPVQLVFEFIESEWSVREAKNLDRIADGRE